MVQSFFTRRLFGKRRIFISCTAVVSLGVMYICYQALSIQELGQQLSDSAANHPAGKQSVFRNNYQHYQKADFPVHLIHSPGEDDAAAVPVAADHHNSLLPRENTFKDHGIRIRGVLNEDVKRYIPNSRGNFRCIHGADAEIAYHRVNDNYCDCPDGSDEPSTSACMGGRFFCEQQPLKPNIHISVTSSRVNDGICDCCDGSDEWGHSMVPEHSRISEFYEEKTGNDQVPCKNRCIIGYVAAERGL